MDELISQDFSTVEAHRNKEDLRQVATYTMQGSQKYLMASDLWRSTADSVFQPMAHEIDRMIALQDST